MSIEIAFDYESSAKEILGALFKLQRATVDYLKHDPADFETISIRYTNTPTPDSLPGYEALDAEYEEMVNTIIEILDTEHIQPGGRPRFLDTIETLMANHNVTAVESYRQTTGYECLTISLTGDSFHLGFTFIREVDSTGINGQGISIKIRTTNAPIPMDYN